MTSGADATRSQSLPKWRSVLAVVAHPDDESFGLGAILDGFARTGAAVSVLCLTHGEASTLHEVAGDLASLRRLELAAAADALGVARTILRDNADGALSQARGDLLSREVLEAIGSENPEGLLVFDVDGVTGHPDHAAASAAGVKAADIADLPVLGWTVPRSVADKLNEEFGTSFTGRPKSEIDLEVAVDRTRQRIASLAHASQAAPTSVLWRRLELLDDTESLCWLRRRNDSPEPAVSASSNGTRPALLRVDYRTGDQFEISVRDHRILVDQPTDAGGEDLAPTPTELFIAGLASCVGFYARRYLRRHQLPTSGLAVEVSYELGTTPARVATVDMRIVVPQGVPDARRAALLAVASHCTVHNSITTPPDISIHLSTA